MRSPALVLVVVAGCTAAAIHRPTTRSVIEASWTSADLPDRLTDEGGACGGLAALPLSVAAQALGDRLRLQAPVTPRTVRFETPPSVMVGPPPEEEAQVLWLEHEGASLAIVATETFAIADGLVERAAELHGAGWTVEAIAVAGGTGALALPDVPHADAADALLGTAYVAGADGLVRRAVFVAARETAARGGCTALVRAIAATLAPGERAIPESATETTARGLGLGVAIDVPPGYSLAWTADCTSERAIIERMGPLGTSADGWIRAMVVGADRSRPSEGSRLTRTLDVDVAWADAEQGDGSFVTEATIPIPNGRVWVSIFARDRATFDRLASIAASVHWE